MLYTNVCWTQVVKLSFLAIIQGSLFDGTLLFGWLKCQFLNVMKELVHQFVMNIVGHITSLHMYPTYKTFITYCKSLNTSRASNTSRGSEVGSEVKVKVHRFVQRPIVRSYHWATPQTQLVNLLCKRMCIVYWAKHTVIVAYMLPAISLL